jgi:hypothetical protein
MMSLTCMISNVRSGAAAGPCVESHERGAGGDAFRNGGR